MKKYLLLLVVTFTHVLCYASTEADRKTCELYRASFNKTMIDQAVSQTDNAFTTALFEAYDKIGSPITPSQITLQLISAVDNMDYPSGIKVQMEASVNAGNNSIVAIASTNMFLESLITSREDETDALGRVISTKLICSQENTGFISGKIYNQATGRTITSLNVKFPYTLSVTLP